MAYPINPPAMFYMRRHMIIEPIYLGDGLVKSRDFWFWEPKREEQKPDDWLVGPYRTRKTAARYLWKFILTMDEGPELRAWEL